ncbi:solute carrier family 66 member 3 [Chelonus insularis]|uniref:solute carrier family 66 member 3 n=1 Tax=Chelonus insularis TaxID=460826 RepID=UPI00158F0C2F|nr:solute carrier family 66 member 3 [Chelonus insularis]
MMELSNFINLNTIGNFLSIITITACFVIKVPQILNLFAAKSVTGISLFSLILELFSYTVTASYNYTNGYAVLSYMEYPIIIIQEYVLIFLVLNYLNKINRSTICIVILYFIITVSFLMQILPKTILTILAPMCTPISASSKIVQLLAIIRAQNSESVSLLTWFISTFTNLTRVFTVWMDSADKLLLGNFIISVLLSSSVMIATIYYKPKSKKA